jgi:hypothetical protein
MRGFALEIAGRLRLPALRELVGRELLGSGF